MWLTKLRRMLDELPSEYLEPEPRGGVPLPPDVKQVGKLNNDEKRLFGLVRQLDNRMTLEFEAYETLHSDPTRSPEDCLRLSINQHVRECELNCVYEILTLSIRERLNQHESEFYFDGDDIYAHPDVLIEQMRFAYEVIGRQIQVTGSDQVFDDLLPDDFFKPIDPKKSN